MLDKLKKEVYEANYELYKRNLVILTWGNVSARSDDNLIVIKPSGIDYEVMTPDDMVVLDINGNIIDGRYKPSSDTPTHIELYKAFKNIKGVCHTHSTSATSFAQAGCPLSAYGTTHADYFYGEIPCTRELTKSEIERDYELNTGKVIIETFKNLDYMAVPGVLVKSHGVFSWGNSARNACHNALVMEEIAKMNFQTKVINNSINSVSQDLLDKHYFRKHGVNAYYGN